jgi:hypothetical protein
VRFSADRVQTRVSFNEPVATRYLSTARSLTE